MERYQKGISMLISKKFLTTVVSTFCLLSIFIVPNAQAGLITISADYINVSADGDNNSVGTVKTDSLSGNEVIARERQNQNQQDMLIASFIQFDISWLTASIVNSSLFSASFDADFAARLNGSNNMSVMLGQVGNSWDYSMGSLPLFDFAGLSTNPATLIGNVKTDAFGTYSLDVTSIVRDWVNGNTINNGFVVYGKEKVYQGAGFNNVALQVEVPEPTSIAILALGIMGLAASRFKKKS